MGDLHYSFKSDFNNLTHFIQNTTDSPGGTTSHSHGIVTVSKIRQLDFHFLDMGAGSVTGEWIWKQMLGSGGFGEVRHTLYLHTYAGNSWCLFRCLQLKGEGALTALPPNGSP